MFLQRCSYAVLVLAASVWCAARADDGAVMFPTVPLKTFVPPSKYTANHQSFLFAYKNWLFATHVAPGDQSTPNEFFRNVVIQYDLESMQVVNEFHAPPDQMILEIFVENDRLWALFDDAIALDWTKTATKYVKFVQRWNIATGQSMNYTWDVTGETLVLDYKLPLNYLPKGSLGGHLHVSIADGYILTVPSEAMKTIKQWDIETGTVLRTFDLDSVACDGSCDDNFITHVTARGGSIFAVVGPVAPTASFNRVTSSGKIVEWNFNTGKVVRNLGIAVHAVTLILIEGETMFVACHDASTAANPYETNVDSNQIMQWNLAAGTLERTYKGAVGSRLFLVGDKLLSAVVSTTYDSAPPLSTVELNQWDTGSSQEELYSKQIFNLLLNADSWLPSDPVIFSGSLFLGYNNRYYQHGPSYLGPPNIASSALSSLLDWSLAGTIAAGIALFI